MRSEQRNVNAQRTLTGMEFAQGSRASRGGQRQITGLVQREVGALVAARKFDACTAHEGQAGTREFDVDRAAKLLANRAG